ncbi:hypothetical protein [Streptomyces sp. SAI-041]|uniref:hypothetical protein n=1 Tax=Streptomyces sp. SAI-041 TaxID=2940548 RepID=UPI0024741CBB|nr:hypothetical protein [Streptomyces sp. SAI-041]MDH6545994.1 hypothetical protein [Streptomyces sp. SAI-041]
MRAEARPDDRADGHGPGHVEVGTRELGAQRAETEVEAHLGPGSDDGASGGTGDGASHGAEPAPDRGHDGDEPGQQRTDDRHHPCEDRPEADEDEPEDGAQDVRPHGGVELLRVLLGRLVQLVGVAVDRLPDRPRLLGGGVEGQAEPFLPCPASLSSRRPGHADPVHVAVDGDSALVKSVTELDPGVAQGVHLLDLDVAEYGIRVFHGGAALPGRDVFGGRLTGAVPGGLWR